MLFTSNLLTMLLLSIFGVVSPQNYTDGGFKATFPVGPSNLNIPGTTLTSFNIIIPQGISTTFFLRTALLNYDYSLYPLVGFNYEYNAIGLPDWVTYYPESRSIKALPPVGFAGPLQFTLNYSDSRSNYNSIPVSLSQGNVTWNSLNYLTSNGIYTAPNVYTLVFPLFTTSGTSLSTIRSSNYGALINVGQETWTTLMPIGRQSIANISTSYIGNASIIQPGLVVSTGTNPVAVTYPNIGVQTVPRTVPTVTNTNIVNPIIPDTWRITPVVVNNIPGASTSNGIFYGGSLPVYNVVTQPGGNGYQSTTTTQVVSGPNNYLQSNRGY